MVTEGIYRVKPTVGVSAALLSILAIECIGIVTMLLYWGLSRLVG